MLEIGMNHKTLRTVLPQYTAASMKSGLLEVLATPIMIAWMEECCMECVQSQLDEGFGTVGTLVNVTHEAPTPVNGEVTISCFLRQVDGRRLVFAVEASDKGGIIGRGSHERFIVNGRKFQEKCDKKKEI
ncbi:MAG: thioesterase family protein [Clostridia bacterium]|nr:thioesterase family protein [Clostridia bacterium]